MRLNGLSNITFSSKINFVPLEFFSNRIDRRNNDCIPSWLAEPCSTDSDEFYSEQLRTCSGGGIINPHKKAVGFHFYDCEKNSEEADKNVDELFKKNPDAERGLLMGGKKLNYRADYSLKQFDKIKAIFLDKLGQVSIFQTHSYPDSETNYHYSVEDDEWTINTQYSNPPGHPKVHDVDTLEKLKSAFNYIHIADGDELCIQGIPVKKEDAPEFFEPIE